MKEATFLGLGSACWVEGLNMGFYVLFIIMMIGIGLGVILGIYHSIKKEIEHQKYIKESKINNIKVEKTKEEKTKEFKEGLINVLKYIGKSILVFVGILTYFWIIGIIIKTLGRCG